MSAGPKHSDFVAAAAVWLLFAIFATALLGFYNYSRIDAEFEAEARTIHRILSQRADQHDAHLTSLAAVVSDTDHTSSTTRAIADAVLRFYPRITAIEVVVLQPTARTVFTTRETGLDPGSIKAVADIAQGLQPGQTTILSERPEAEYALVKRVPSGAVVMTIDALRLSESDGVLGKGTVLTLKAPAGQEIARLSPDGASEGSLPALRFEKALGSRSQPLGVLVQRQMFLIEVLPAAGVILALGATGLATLLGMLVLIERRKAREARERAAFHEQDAVLARAAKVNTLGEMASGIAHELTQPLTAILSQSQAGLRMAQDRKTPEEIVRVLEANARGAKRAGDILARLRDYIASKPPEAEPVGLNGLVRNVAEFAKADLEQRRVQLTLELSSDKPRAMIDRVSVEQVVHNLLRNAVDAVQELPEPRRTIRITTGVAQNSAFVAVRDAGEGISSENLPRIFEPFFTTKGGGMGLGLPLCERLVEGFGGQVTAANDPQGGAVFTIRLPALA